MSGDTNVSGEMIKNEEPDPSQGSGTGSGVSKPVGSQPSEVASPEQNTDGVAGTAWFKKLRGWIMVVAVQVASMAYAAGLSPPGGFWQDDIDPHTAGFSILRDKSPHRYLIFFYANATAFMASLVIIILISSEEYYTSQVKVFMLYVSMVTDLISLVIAYAAGCARSTRTSVYVIVLAIVVLLLTIYSAKFIQRIWCFLVNLSPCLRNRCPTLSQGCKSQKEKAKAFMKNKKTQEP